MGFLRTVNEPNHPPKIQVFSDVYQTQEQVGVPIYMGLAACSIGSNSHWCSPFVAIGPDMPWVCRVVAALPSSSSFAAYTPARAEERLLSELPGLPLLWGVWRWKSTGNQALCNSQNQLPFFWRWRNIFYQRIKP